MQHRTFGRVGWQMSEVGYGMWGMAGWSGSDDEQSLAALDRAVELGCNFFDTAWAYGDGRSEQLLGRTLARHHGRELYVATKIPPKNRQWPGLASYGLEDVFPADYIREYTELSLRNIGVDTLDLQQFHVWSSCPPWRRASRRSDGEWPSLEEGDRSRSRHGGRAPADGEGSFRRHGEGRGGMPGASISIRIFRQPEGLESDAMINVRPSFGNRSRSVDDPAAREAIVQLVARSFLLLEP